jgi:ribosomal-protein-alanine N-acetyltransferase
MEFLLDRARERGMHDLFLEVRVSNVAALALYRRFGFSVLTVRSRYYSDGEDANLLHCVLPEMDDAAEETPEAAGGLRTER